MINKAIEFDVNCVVSALDEIRKIEEIANKAYSDDKNNHFALAIACMSSAAFQDLTGYLTTEQFNLIKQAKEANDATN